MSTSPVSSLAKANVCLSVTLNHTLRNAFGRFDAGDPKNANLTGLAIDQMHGIVYLSQRPELDSDRIGVGGASYGGFFATLIDGAAPRVKAGMSFFAGGHHEMGTNLPQFTATTQNVPLWRNLNLAIFPNIATYSSYGSRPIR